MSDAKATFRLEGEDATAAAFRSALGNVQEFSEKATRLIRGAFGFEIVNIFAEQVKGLAEMGDQLAKGAERAGIAQAQFNQLAAAFGEADVSVQSLSKGIKNMQVAISSATSGNDTIAAAFNEMGLSAAELKQLAPEVQLLAIAEAVSKIEDPADRARLGAAALGRQFLELEPELAKGAAGLDEIVKAANGMTVETTEKLSKFNEQMNHLWQGIKNLAAAAAGGFADTMSQLHDQFSPETADRIRMIQTMLKSPGNWGESRVAQLNAELTELQGKLAAAAAAKSASPAVSAALDQQGAGISERLTREFTEAAVKAMEAQDKLAEENKKTLEEWSRELDTVDDKRTINEIKFQILFEKGMKTRAQEYAFLDQEENKRAAALDSQQNSAAISAGIKAREDEFKGSMAAMSQAAREAEENNKRLFERTGQYAVQTGDLIQGTFARAFENIGKGGLRGLVADFVHAFATIVANAQAMDLAKAMGITDAFSNQGGGSALGGIFGGLKSLFGGGDSTAVTFNNGAGTASLLGYANGGSFNVGGAGGTDSQLVAFRATPGERVSIKTPGQQGGGVTVVNNNYIDARTDATQIGQLIQASTQRAVQQSKSEMTQLIKRGAFS